MMIVSLLSSSPKNGVEIMDGVEEMTRGWWRPSPGSVYPLLEKMGKEGTIKKRDDGRYELTSKAKVQLDASFGPKLRGPRTVDDMVTQMHGFVSYFEDSKSAGREELEPHMDRIKSLAKRLSELVGKKESETESE